MLCTALPLVAEREGETFDYFINMIIYTCLDACGHILLWKISLITHNLQDYPESNIHTHTQLLLYFLILLLSLHCM